MEIQGLEEFITQFPIFEYRIVGTETLSFENRVRQICQMECERYGTTWACPPGVGTIEECKERCLAYSHGLLFSSVAEVSDVLNMEEMLATRRDHEEITNEVGKFLREAGLRPIRFPQSPATFARNVPIQTPPAVFLKRCTPVWRAMAWWSQKWWRKKRWNITWAEIPFFGFL